MPTETSARAPAIVEYNQRLFIAWRGKDKNNLLNLSSAEGPEQFGDKERISAEQTLATPALAVFNGVLRYAWTGTDKDRHLNIMSTTDGHTFTDENKLGDQAAGGPALATVGYRLFMAWRGRDKSHNLNVASSGDGINFGGKKKLARPANSRPALAEHNGDLYLAYHAPGNTARLIRSSDGTQFTDIDETGSGVLGAPALASFGGYLFMGWAESSGLIIQRYWSDAKDGSPVVFPTQEKDSSLALTKFQDTLVAAWQTNVDDLVTRSSSDGVNFGALELVDRPD